MLGTKWRVGATMGLLAVALTGCGIIPGTGGQQPTTTRTVTQAERDELMAKVFDADVAASLARDEAGTACRGVVGFRDLTDPSKCKAIQARSALFDKSQKCMQELDKYNKGRGSAQRLEKGDQITVTRKVGGVDKVERRTLTCGFDRPN